MNWVTTNIRFPEELYMELRMEAARRKTSVASIIRERVAKKKAKEKTRDVKKEMRDLEKLARANAKYMRGVNLTKALIEMRYEQ